MNKQLLLKQTLIVALAVGLSACGQAMSGYGGGTNISTGKSIPEIPFDQIEASTKEAEQAMVEAEVAIKNAVEGEEPEELYPGQNGGLNAKPIAEKSLTGIPEKLGKALDKLYVKLTIPVTKAKEAVAKSRAQLAAALSGLNPANPLHQEMIKKLTEMMSRLDGLENRFGGIYTILALKVDLLVKKLDMVIAGLNVAGNPLLLLPMWELQELRKVIVEFRDKLANT